jgi:hypothetical protein
MLNFENENINKEQFLNYTLNHSDSKKNDDISEDNIEILKNIFSK